MGRESGVGGVSIRSDYAYDDVVATRHDDIMVVRYFMRVDETVEGEEVLETALRLTVFRKMDGRWKVVSHANFGATN